MCPTSNAKTDAAIFPKLRRVPHTMRRIERKGSAPLWSSGLRRTQWHDRKAVSGTRVNESPVLALLVPDK